MFLYETYVYDEEFVEDEETGEVIPVDLYAVRITGYEGTDSYLTIPSEIDEMPVLEIAEKAFYRKDLTSVTFHESIESIDEESFAENNILYVVFYGYDTTIMNNAFKGNELEVIYGYKDSEPQDFSERQNISFIEIEESGLEGDITYIEEIPEQSIVYGDEANFPSKLEAKLSDDSVISVNVFWHNKDFDPYEEGTYVILGDLVLPPNINNPKEIRPTISISVEKIPIISVGDLPSVEVEFGDDPDLPSQVYIGLGDEQGSESVVYIDWDLTDFNKTVPGTYTLYGDLILIDYFSNPHNLKAEVKVTVNKRWIVSVDHLHRIEVDYGTEFEDLPLSDKVSVNLSDNTSEFFDVDWTVPSYNPYIPGTYGFIGNIITDEVTENKKDIQVYVMVILRPEVAELDAEDDSLFIVLDLAGREFAMQATTELNESLDNNPSLSFTLYPSPANNLFIDDISEMWEVIDDNDTEYKITYVERKGVGSSDEPPSYEELDINGIPLDFRLWESGYIDINGNERDRGRDVRMSTYEKINGSTEYELTNYSDFTTIFLREYDENGELIKRDSSISVSAGSSTVFTTFDNTRYFRIFFNDYDEKGIDVNDVGFRLKASIKPAEDDIEVNENLLTHDLNLWEQGSLSVRNGRELVSSRRVKTKNLIELIPYTTYTLSGANKSTGYVAYHLYDDKGMWLRGDSGSEEITFTTGSKETHLRVVVGRDDDDEIDPTDIGVLIRAKLEMGDTPTEWVESTVDGNFPVPKISEKLIEVEVKAIPKFFDDFDTDRIYKEYNRHMTAQYCFNLIFKNTDYNFVLHSNYESLEWENFGGGESKLESFKRALNRYGAEFEIVGNTVHIKPLIGRDSQFQFRYKLNASNIVQEVDATEFYTYAKGYGDYGNEDAEEGEGETSDWQDAKLIREYTSPLANISSIGIRHAPPLKDGRITKRSTMDARLRTLVDESAQISVSADIQDLRDQGYSLGQPQIGDRVFLIDERIGFNGEVRIVDMTTVRDWRGRIIDIQMTFGTEGILRTHQSNLQTAVESIQDVISGNKTLPYSVLDNAVKQATKALQGAQTELSFTNRGIFAIDKKDPNKQVILNSEGLGVSRDGGATYGNAITGDGINANFITAGTMVADRIAGGTLSSINGNTEFNLNKGDLFMEKANFTLGSGANIRFTDRGNKLYFKHTGKDNITRSAGLIFGLGITGRPLVSVGSSSPGVDNRDFSWSGLTISSQASQTDEDSFSSITSRNFLFRDRVNYNKAIKVDLKSNRPSIHPIFGESVNYDLGTNINFFDRIYVRDLRAKNIYRIINNYDTGKGYMFETQYSGDGSAMSFRGRNLGSYNYNLGAKGNSWNRLYVTNPPDITSDEREKEDISKLNLGLDFIKK